MLYQSDIKISDFSKNKSTNMMNPQKTRRSSAGDCITDKKFEKDALLVNREPQMPTSYAIVALPSTREKGGI